MNRDAGIAIAGFAGFQLLNAWNNNAPSLNDLRSCPPTDTVTQQKLRDADILVGGTVVILGGTIYLLSKDTTVLWVMGAVFVSVSLWHHKVLNSAPAGLMDKGIESYGD